MLELELSKKDFDVCITNNSITVGAGTDIFCSFVFVVKNDMLHIYSSNGRAGILSKINLLQDASREDVVFAVEAWRVRSWSSVSSSDIFTFQYDKGSLTLKDNLGSVTFPCSSADLFPFWDKTFEDAQDSKERVSSEFLKKAFTFVKPFIADSESDRPEIAVTESSNGVLSATNALVLASVRSEVFDRIPMRVHGKDLSTLLKFLATCKGEPVEVYPSDKALFIEKEGGTIFTLARPSVPMKKLVVPDEKHMFVSVENKKFVQGIKKLASALPKDEDKIYLRIKGNDLVLSDGTDKNEMSIPCSVEKHKGELPDDGFSFTFEYLLKILSFYDIEPLKMGIILYEKDEQILGGMVCVEDEKDDAKYTSDLVWQI